jgi:hypothetical protein
MAEINGNLMQYTENDGKLTLSGYGVVGKVFDSGGQFYNVKTFGAKGDGVNDDTTAIQNAYNAALTIGGIVFLPAGTYLISRVINVAGNGNQFGTVLFMGVGWQSIILIKNNTNIYAFDMGGIETWNMVFRDFKIDCNGVNQTAGGGIYARGAVCCKFENLWIHSPYNEGINISPIAAGNIFSHHNLIDACLFDGGASIPTNGNVYGVYMFSTEQNIIRHCIFENLGNPAVSEPHAIFDNATHNLFDGNVFLVTSNGVNSLCMQGIQSSAVNNIFDGGGGHCIRVTRDNVLIEGNLFYSIGSNQVASGNAKAGVYVATGGVSNTRIIGNGFEPCNSGAGFADSAVFLDGSSKNSLVTNNDMAINQSNGSWVNGPVHTTGSLGTGNVIRNNPGFNPVGSQTPPAIPSSTVALTNPFPYDMTVFITGGTVTVIAIGGTSTGLTSGAFRVPANQTIKLTYSVAPTWTWFAD